jgi:predicted molibdopterin-dependent oxidoreductase YjgC
MSSIAGWLISPLLHADGGRVVLAGSRDAEATGTLVNREMRAQSLQRLAAFCS